MQKLLKEELIVFFLICLLVFNPKAILLLSHDLWNLGKTFKWHNAISCEHWGKLCPKIKLRSGLESP